MSSQADGEGCAIWNVPIARAAGRIASVMLAMLLAVTMLPVAGLSSAFADEPVERPATSGGDVALESTNSDNAATEPQTPIAETREDGMLAADGLLYTVADGGLSLVGFDGDAPEGALTVSDAVSVDGKDTPVVAINLAEGQIADKVVVLSLPQGIKNVNTSSLAAAFPNLLSVEVAAAAGSSLPVASGAASMRAAYSTSGGMLFRPASVAVQTEDGLVESIECKELVWAPPALVSARIPVECRAIAEGAFADARDLKTVVAFGTMERIADGAFSTEQMESSKVVVPASSPVVVDEGTERVSASMALMGDAGQKERRRAWHEAGWRSDDIVMGKPCGALTETVAVNAEGTIERDELQLVSYPGAHERAMDLKKPNADGIVEQAESGLAFTVKSDMTAIVTWQGDKTAMPAHIDIPATIVIDDVTYPVTEIAPNAFEGAVFLTSVTIPECVTAIGQDAFRDCLKLADLKAPFTLKVTDRNVLVSGAAGQRSDLRVGASDEGTGLSSDGVIAERTSASTDSESSLNNLANEEVGMHPSEGITSFSESDSVSVFASASANNTFDVVPSCGESIIVQIAGAIEKAEHNNNRITLRYTYGGDYRLGAYTSNSGTIQLIWRRTADGAETASASLVPTNGWCFASVSRSIASSSTTTDANSKFGVVLVRDGVMGSRELLTQQDAEKLYQSKGNYITKAVSELDNFYDKAKFNTISYEGLDEADHSGALPTFYVNDASKLPKVPEPRREGHEFLGWTWTGQATPTKDPGAAFAGGAVTLTANWDESEPATSEAKHFFTSDAPLRHDDASATQTHVIKVRLSSSPGTLASVSFEGDDRTGLLKDTSGVKLFVGAFKDALSSGTELSWGGATSSGWECELARFADDSYGVYVGVSIPTAAIDEASIPVSYADGSYVASLVKMNYAFA